MTVPGTIFIIVIMVFGRVLGVPGDIARQNRHAEVLELASNPRLIG